MCNGERSFAEQAESQIADFERCWAETPPADLVEEMGRIYERARLRAQVRVGSNWVEWRTEAMQAVLDELKRRGLLVEP